MSDQLTHEPTSGPGSELQLPAAPPSVTEVRVYFNSGRDTDVRRQIGHRVDLWVNDGKLKIIADARETCWVVATSEGGRLIDTFRRGVVANDLDFRDDGDDRLPIHNLVPLTDADVRVLMLALDGVDDDSQGAPSLRSRDREDAFEEDADRCDPWAGRLNCGEVAMLAGAPKAGKSTILRGLLRAGSGTGRSVLLGGATRPFGAIVVSEEPKRMWREVADNTRVRFVSDNPIRKFSEWDTYVRNLELAARASGAKVVVIDTLSRLVAFDENSSRAVTRAMTPLRAVAARYGLCVLVVHHTGRSGTVRGSTALEAQVDAVLTVSLVGDDVTDTRRRLDVVSRAAPAERIEYTMGADGGLVLWSPSVAGATRPTRATKMLFTPSGN